MASPEPGLGQALSALTDGEADAAETSALLRAWPERGLREQWQAYHLIGDTLRSAELARELRPGEDLLARLRPQLLAEPRVIAPPACPRLQQWLAPAAVAAGFVALAAGFTSLPLFQSPRADVMAVAMPRASVLPTPGMSFVQSAGLAGDVLLMEPQIESGIAPAAVTYGNTAPSRP